jgi:toxin HigB-1
MKKNNPALPMTQVQTAYQILITDDYKKRAKRFLRKHPDLAPVYIKAMTLLEANPFHPSLRLHPLKGNLAGLHSVSINLSYRITLEFLILDRQVTPVNVDDHDAVY